ncbi:hypothetical protein BGW36DRAFT_370841 [Talaromyces proteolyticus]|uniref:Uncharacterized protein n=1 Tax=Talaromyces proteolyticus TaxID=1131652 RepID=A0AAD4L0W5_9EURO|nr:uncharacterized protein BGW36DRAFT_370841 [Talaromyces proteolyticus]KAH8704189.1 hypothetical protein BGW36DRAFT_370841 [Talaromyces proteolyticus]
MGRVYQLLLILLFLSHCSIFREILAAPFISAYKMSDDTPVIPIPESHVNSVESNVRITNCPESASGVTPIQVVTLNRPNKRNAITDDMVFDLIAYFSAAEVDERVRAIILTGIGKHSALALT